MDRLGTNVRRERQARGWSQADLAKAVGYASAAMIDRIEQGIKRPSYEQLEALAKVFGVTVSDLVGDKTPCAVTNNASGAHAIGYQHNEGAVLMTDELQQVVRTIVREELTVQREQLVHDIRVVLREAAPGLSPRAGREADDGSASSAPEG